jgi:hypothetical protein
LLTALTPAGKPSDSVEHIIFPLSRLCTEKEASSWLTPGTAPWYFAQGLTPPPEETEKAGEQG